MISKKFFPASLSALIAFSCGACSNIPDKNNTGVDPLTGAVTTETSGPALVEGKKYPVATPSATPEVVVSPHKPHNLVGVKNYKSGDKVRDPYTKQIFLVP